MITFALVLLAASPLELGGQSYRDVEGPLVLEVGGVKATVRASVSLRLQDLAQYGAGEQGVGFIDWRWPSGANTDGLTIAFEKPVSFVAVDAGDWGSDDDGLLELTAWSCDHRLLQIVTRPWDVTRSPPFVTLTVKAKGICSVRYRSGGDFAGSTFITRLRAE